MKYSIGGRARGTQMDVEELRQGLTSAIALALMVLGGVGAWWCLQPGSRVRDALSVISCSLLGVGCLIYACRTKHSRVARGLLLAGPILTLALALMTLRSPVVPYAAVLIVIVNAAVSPFLGLAAAALSTIIIWALLPQGELLFSSLALLWLTLGMSWLSSRGLYIVLGWAWMSQERAARLLEELRGRQGELNRTLAALTEASRRLQRVNSELALARVRADEARRLQEQFAANISHELRTPLNLIVGFSEMMVTSPHSYGGVPLPPAYRGDVTAIYRSAKHLSDLINDVLDLSQIESGHMTVRKQMEDLGQVLREAVDIVRDIVTSRGLRLNLDLPEDPPLLRLDRTRIRQVLLNLLANAIRFTDHGSIRASLRVEGREAEICVEDTGCGIAADKLSQAFEPFSRLGNDPNRGGTGLGLAMSKHFVELHGGRMWIESEVGHGTAVYFTLPLPAEEGEATALFLRPGRAPARVEQPVVLVLHDDPWVLGLLERSLDGYHFELADTVEKVEQAVADLLPEAAIIDTAWGHARREALSRLELPTQMAVVTLPLPSPRRLAATLGAADYLAKPVSREALAAALSQLPRPPQKVLVVDDEAHMVRLLTRMLKASDPSLTVLEAFSGEEGLAVARSERPNLVLLDLVMPGMDGYEMLREARIDEQLAGTAFIVLSGHALEQEPAPTLGELHVARGEGFSLSDVLQALCAILPVLTRPAVTPAATDAGHPAGRPA